MIKRTLLKDTEETSVVVEAQVKILEAQVESLEAQVKNLEKQDAIMEKPVDCSNANRFLTRFRNHFVSVDLIRIGGEGDGGYLVPDILDGISHCFSPGVSDTSDFEDHLSKKYGIKSFMADASVDCAPISDPNFSFSKKFLGNRDEDDFITLSSWVDTSLKGDERELILQMDIEGGEYDVLTFESDETLKRFSVMAIEFHDLGQMGDEHFFQMFSSIFEKIYKNFTVCHVHPNNCCGIFSSGEWEFPRVTEVTFVRNDYVEKLRNGSKLSLPHHLDRKNVEAYEDISMPERWWKC
ncbi:FkbM family methyltransferase [Roseovarius arcticus]|uniref:FkbM family methyltransferase n=1 Tax=Roseovarius arcticus TaxID=2547404 RepID=UPI001486DFE2|nr:FkbM family methyltransferase [Roseovarius arcticus]